MHTSRVMCRHTIEYSGEVASLSHKYQLFTCGAGTYEYMHRASSTY